MLVEFYTSRKGPGGAKAVNASRMELPSKYRGAEWNWYSVPMSRVRFNRVKALTRVLICLIYAFGQYFVRIKFIVGEYERKIGSCC